MPAYRACIEVISSECPSFRERAEWHLSTTSERRKKWPHIPSGSNSKAIRPISNTNPYINQWLHLGFCAQFKECGAERLWMSTCQLAFTTGIQTRPQFKLQTASTQQQVASTLLLLFSQPKLPLGRANPECLSREPTQFSLRDSHDHLWRNGNTRAFFPPSVSTFPKHLRTLQSDVRR